MLVPCLTMSAVLIRKLVHLLLQLQHLSGFAVNKRYIVLVISQCFTVFLCNNISLLYFCRSLYCCVLVIDFLKLGFQRFWLVSGLQFIRVISPVICIFFSSVKVFNVVIIIVVLKAVPFKHTLIHTRSMIGKVNIYCGEEMLHLAQNIILQLIFKISTNQDAHFSFIH